MLANLGVASKLLLMLGLMCRLSESNSVWKNASFFLPIELKRVAVVVS